jgi:23S rRNA (uracil1939-C5)-methyltransferase
VSDTQELVDLGIERFAMGGRGLAVHEGKVVFVAGALPGERVRARVTKRHKRFDEAEAIETLAGMGRPAPCLHAASCGGCDWMRLDYKQQLSAKEQLIREHFLRALGKQVEGAWAPIVPSPKPMQYRCRITLKVRPEGVGYFAPASHRFVPIATCGVATPAIGRALDWLRLHASRLTDSSAELELRAGEEDEAAVAVVRSGKVREELLAQAPVFRGVAGQRAAVGDTALTYDAGGCTMTASAAAFVQVNLAVNRLLVERVVAAVGGGGTVWDVFCGNGNFAVPVAKTSRVVGMEGSAAALIDAAKSAARNGVEAQWVGISERRMQTQFAKLPTPSAVVVDPPRAGAKQFFEDLFATGIAPSRIAYVSCDPATLLRDLTDILRQGYRLTSLGLFDMFPQTHHVETLAVLDRDG